MNIPGKLNNSERTQALLAPAQYTTKWASHSQSHMKTLQDLQWAVMSMLQCLQDWGEGQSTLKSRGTATVPHAGPTTASWRHPRYSIGEPARISLRIESACIHSTNNYHELAESKPASYMDSSKDCRKLLMHFQFFTIFAKTHSCQQTLQGHCVHNLNWILPTLSYFFRILRTAVAFKKA